MYTYLFDWDIYNLREEFDELKTKKSKSFSVDKSRRTISQALIPLSVKFTSY